MHPNTELIERFYAALGRRDWVAMAACYHPEVHFTDEVFDLHRADATLMWRMLCTNGRDLQVAYRDVQADDRAGMAHWDARYTFAATGRKVLNRIDARFDFRDKLIVRHVDRFDFWAWSRQALGPAGLLLGWSDSLRDKVRSRALRSLATFGAQVCTAAEPTQAAESA